MVFLAGLAALCVAIAVQMARSDDHVAHVVSKYVALFGAILIVIVALGAYGDVGLIRRLRAVELTADDIVREGWSSRTRLPWADVAGVMAAFEQQPLIVITGSNGEQWNHEVTTPHVPLGRARRPIWMLDRPARSGSICVECPRLAVDEHRVLRFLSFYADNPAFRSELGTQLSLDRWRALR
ncbi:hypothetical protein [Nocardia cyriacigeorgica]|uniref:hypothetical protein n=1 Tax=Nocardia cyriacigeorgica TaxID=135487 RepID=UPI001894D4EC|nr:hypothetical protein [Nocardia cyriacigeorgica]MBF6436080.1 hypothetical protein [Nocardia cyriacigeorgica]